MRVKKTPTEYQNFENVVSSLLKVPHAEIKAKLDAEKKEKAKRKKENPKRIDSNA